MNTNQETKSTRQWRAVSSVLKVAGVLVSVFMCGLIVFIWLNQDGIQPDPTNVPGASSSMPAVAQPRSSSGAPHESEGELSAALERGRELSLVYCASCHIYPEPEILDRFTWAMETLPRMSYWLGLSENDLTGQPGIAELVQAGLLPTAPLLSVEDWKAICNFYLDAAPAAAVEITNRPRTKTDLTQFEPRIIPANGRALTSMIRIIPGERRLLVGNGLSNTVDVLSLEGRLLRREKVDSAVVDAFRTPDGWQISLIGSLPPADDARGAVALLPDKGGPLVPILTGLRRPVQSLLHDLNGDGLQDRVINEYGNIAGGVFWQRNLGNGDYVRDILLEQPGAARSAIADFNGDGRPDIAVITAQARESVTLLLNNGKGGFAPASAGDYHPAWGNVHLEVADFNGDGRPDLLTANGDSADYMTYPTPLRAYHGLRILLNEGLDAESQPTFREAFFFPMYGAYKAFARDFDEDGDLDIAACAYYPHYPTRPEDSFVYLENQGELTFTASTRSEAMAGRWIAMDAADADGDGDIDLVLGSYLDGPGEVPEKLSQAWDIRGASALYFENQLR